MYVLTNAEDLVAAHQRRIFRISLRLLGDVDEAQSATQDCFMRAFDAADRCPADDVGCTRWLNRIAVNLCLDRLRSRKWMWWRGRDELPAQSDAMHSPRTPERESLNRELRSRLMQEALDKLSPRQRAVFVLRHYEDYPLEQIAEELSLSTGTVKTHLSRALENMREELKEFYGTPASK